MSKVITISEAINIIKDYDTVAIGGFVGIGHPEEIISEMEKKFLKTGKPNDLTIVYAAGQGDRKTKGINHLAHVGLIKKVIFGHIGLAPKMAELITSNLIEAYNFPQGVITQLCRDIASKKPGTITKTGINTFVDPRISGGRTNKISNENLVEIININNDDYLFYKYFPINIALIKGTYADEHGNISMEKEACSLEMLAMAQAAHNCGGKVIAQVDNVVKNSTLNPWLVKIPGVLVDSIIIANEKYKSQTFTEKYNPSLSGEIRIPTNFIKCMPLNINKVICRRALMEIKSNSSVNLGFGIPEGISLVANEENKLNLLDFSIESGVTGGIPCSGLNFGASYNPDSIIDQPSQFDFYDGGGLDIAFLGMAQVDKCGNVNVSYFDDNYIGCGGFINISQNTKRVVFCGTFSTGDLKTQIKNCNLIITNEGKIKKFVNKVNHITFSGKNAIKNGQSILYITERSVFKLINEGIELIEFAPGVDVKKNILDQMAFKPLISKNITFMNKSIFKN